MKTKQSGWQKEEPFAPLASVQPTLEQWGPTLSNF